MLMPEQNKIHAVEAKTKQRPCFFIPKQKNPGVKSEKLISALDLARLHFGWELLNVLVSEVRRTHFILKLD